MYQQNIKLNAVFCLTILFQWRIFHVWWKTVWSVKLYLSEWFSVCQNFLAEITELHFHGKSRVVISEAFPSPCAFHVRQYSWGIVLSLACPPPHTHTHTCASTYMHNQKPLLYCITTFFDQNKNMSKCYNSAATYTRILIVICF